MFDGPLETIERADLQRLVDNAAEESRTLEFKRDLRLEDRDAKREFLADVTAFANTQGGHLVYGLAERDGVAAELPGVTVADRDAERLKIENLLRDGVEPRIPIVHPKWIDLGEDKWALLIRVRPSMLAPHRVMFDSKFYRRSSGGKAAMDVFELRAAFAASAEIPERVRQLHRRMVEAVVQRRTPVPLADRPHLVVTVMPWDALTSAVELELGYTAGAAHPIGLSNSDGFHTLDGFVVSDIASERRVFTLTARSGYAQWVFAPSVSEAQRLYLQYAERDLSEWISRAIEFLRQRDLAGPFTVVLSLTKTPGLTCQWNEHSSLGSMPRTPVENPLELPPMVIEAYSGDALEPLLRLFWYAFGWERPHGWKPAGG
jgi:hypothetical protein